MAHYHLCVKMLSRSTRNTVSALAYRAGITLTCDRTGETFDYTNKPVSHVDLILPESAPAWIRSLKQEIQEDRAAGLQKLSNLLEAAERRVDAQVYRELEFSLPRELTDAQNRALATDFLQRECASLGMGVIANFHFDVDSKTGERKPHCHALVFLRELTPEGFSKTKTRSWNSKDQHQRFRQGWAEIQNEYLERHGVDQRVDHRSYAARGLDLEPQIKYGKAVHERFKKGLSSLIGDEAQRLQARNLFRITARPDLVLDLVTQTQSTFVWADVQKVLHRYADSLETFQRLEARVRASKTLVPLKEGVYTTRSLLKIEYETEEGVAALKTETGAKVDAQVVAEVLQAQNARLAAYGGLTAQQKEVISGLVSPEKVKTLVGLAGTGKSTSLGAAKAIWEGAGLQVVGLAPTRKAVQNLQAEGLTSQTVASFLATYDQGRSRYRANTVLVVDEVGLIDSRTLGALVCAIQNLKVKVMFVGDPHQLQPIGAGPVFRRVLEKVPPLVLDQVVRQRAPWMRQASEQLGRGDVAQGLAPYLARKALRLVPEKAVTVSDTDPNDQVLGTYAYTKQVAGCVFHQMAQELNRQGVALGDIPRRLKDHPLHEAFKRFQGLREQAKGLAQARQLDLEGAPATGYRQATKERMVSDWMAARAEDPTVSSVMIATTRGDVADLNRLAKAKLQEAGEVSQEGLSFPTVELKEDAFGRLHRHTTVRTFSVGDQILFKRNDRGLQVTNGMLGRITDLTKQKMTVQLVGADTREISFSVRLYPYLHHGWASTIFTTQGTTYDRVYALLDRTNNRTTASVMATRHRVSFQGYAPSSEFASLDEVVATLSQSGDKLLGRDYVGASEMQALLQRDETFLEKASRVVARVKDVGHAVKGFFWGPGDRESLSQIDPSTLHGPTESLRAEEVLKETGRGLDRPVKNLSRGVPSLEQGVSPSFSSRVPRQHSVDLGALNEAVCESVDLERLGRHLGLIQGKRFSGQGDQVRFGRKGSFSLQRDKNLWHDFETGAGGNAFSMVTAAGIGRDYKDQLSFLADFTSSSVRQEIADFLEGKELSCTIKKRPSKEVSQEASRAHDLTKEAAVQKQQAIRALVKQSVSLSSTQAETYLRQERGLTGPFPESVRYLKPGTPFSYPTSSEKRFPYGALLSLAHDRQGTLKAVQVTRLNGRGGRGLTSQGQKLSKLTFGAPKGAFVDLSPEKSASSSPVFLAEGVETALSLTQAGARNVKASLGVANLARFETEASHVVIAADQDGTGAASEKALAKACATLKAKGCHVSLLFPSDDPQEKQDFNDLLRQEGLAKVQDRLRPFLPADTKDLARDQMPVETPLRETEQKPFPNINLLGSIQAAQEAYQQSKKVSFEQEIRAAHVLETLYKKALHQDLEVVAYLQRTGDQETREALRKLTPLVETEKLCRDMSSLSPEKASLDALLARLKSCQEQMKDLDHVSFKKECEIRHSLRLCYQEIARHPEAASRLEKTDPHAYKEVQKVQQDLSKNRDLGRGL